MPSLFPEALVGRQDQYSSTFSVALGRAMLRGAREASREGVSYRGFRVGAIAQVVLPQLGVVLFLRGFNNSPYRGAPKRCAEMDILSQTTELAELTKSKPYIVDLFVAGPNDPDLVTEVNGLPSATLHPCAECRDLLQIHPAVSEVTRITTFGIEPGGLAERQTFGEMLARYDGIPVPPNSRVELERAGSGLVVPAF